MKFCKCGGILLPSKDEKGKIKFKCRTCGKVSKAAEGVPTVIKREVNSKKGIPVIDTAKSNEKLSTVHAICPKCNHDRAMSWTVQMRASDEPATQFFKCAKCGHQWRDYS